MRLGKISASLPAALLTAAISFLVFLPSLSGEILNYDDWLYTEAPHVVSFSLERVFTEVVAGNWHPLTVLSFALDSWLMGADPGWLHLVNNIFHSLNTLLVFFVAAKVFGSGRVFDRGTVASAFAALLFGLHPLHVESVSWIAERKDVLCGFFFLSSLLAYIRYAEGSPGKRALTYSLSLVFAALALLSKPMAVTLPIVFFIADYHPLRRLNSVSGLLRLLPEKAPFFLLSVVSGLLTLWAQKAGGAVVPLDFYPLGWRLWFSVRAVVFYLYKTIVPVGLSPFYPIDVGVDYFGLGAAGAAVVIIIITAFTLVSATRTRAFLAAWAYLIVTLAPVLGIVQVGAQAAADRYMYLPSLGLFLLAGAGLYVALDAGKRAAATALVCAIAIIVAMSALTVRQQAFWQDSVALWSREIEMFPGFARGYNSRGSAWAEAGEYIKAIEDYDVAIRIKPSYPEAYINRGMSRLRLEEYERAKQDFVAAIRLNPRLGVAYHYLSRALMGMGETGNAREAERIARELGYR